MRLGYTGMTRFLGCVTSDEVTVTIENSTTHKEISAQRMARHHDKIRRAVKEVEAIVDADLDRKESPVQRSDVEPDPIPPKRETLPPSDVELRKGIEFDVIHQGAVELSRPPIMRGTDTIINVHFIASKRLLPSDNEDFYAFSDKASFEGGPLVPGIILKPEQAKMSPIGTPTILRLGVLAGYEVYSVNISGGGRALTAWLRKIGGKAHKSDK